MSKVLLKHQIFLKLLPLLVFITVLCPLYSIELTAPDWEIVADGLSVSIPEKTSWGYVTVTDGRTLIGWTESGKKVFQRKLRRKPSSLLCADPSDFIWSVTDDRQYLSLFNPDGLLLWEKKLPSHCSDADLVPGRDGRMFICLDNALICVDMNGRTIWNQEIEKTSLHTLKENNDGSLVLDGKDVYSPFGEHLTDVEISETEEFTPISDDIVTATCIFRTSQNSRNSSITAYDFDDSELWSKSFAPEKVLFYEITDNTIMTLSESWVIAGYRYNSTPVNRTIIKSPSDMVYEADYGLSSEEQRYRSLVNSLKRIVRDNESVSVNPSTHDVTYELKYLNQAEASGFDFSSLLADIIQTETDPQVLEMAVSAAGNIGRDPQGLVYDAIEIRLKQRTSFQFDDSMYAAFCDALYAICARSGTSARLIRALEIISPLTSRDYHTLVYEHASDTIERLVNLKISR